MNKRIDYLDTLRVIACFLVVLTHSAIPASDPSNGIYYAFISLLCSPNNGLFFSISGALLRPTTLAIGEFNLTSSLNYQKANTSLEYNHDTKNNSLLLVWA